MSVRRITACVAMVSALSTLPAWAADIGPPARHAQEMDRDFLLWLEVYGDAKGEVFDPLDLADAEAGKSQGKTGADRAKATTSAPTNPKGTTK